MSNPGAMLAARIQADLKELTVLIERARHGWEKAKTQHDDYYHPLKPIVAKYFS